MLIAASLVAMQINTQRSMTSPNTPTAGYATWALLAIILAFVIVIFIRAGARRSPKR